MSDGTSHYLEFTMMRTKLLRIAVMLLAVAGLSACIVMPYGHPRWHEDWHGRP